MNLTIDWVQLAAVATVVSVVGAIGLWIVRRWLHSEFVGHGQHRQLAERVERIEVAKGNAVTREEFQTISDRVGRVETGIAVVQSSVTAAGEAIRRVEHSVNLLLEHALQGDKA